MNITEINVTDRVIITRRPNEKEVATVKGFTPKGGVIVRDSANEIVVIAPEQVLKKL